MDYFSTGDVSKKLKLSLRTLRYYDQIGLVKPTRKELNGKRYYTPDDLLLLQKVLLLKATSMSLNDIHNVIRHVTIQKTLVVHKEQLEQTIQQLQQSLAYTHTLLNILKLEGEIQWDQLLPLLSEENQSLKQEIKKKAFETLFNDEEQEVLAELPKMGDDPNTMAKWINLIKRIDLCIEENKSPISREGQLIAHDTLLLSNETFKGNAELADKFWLARKSKETSADLNLYPVREEVVVFMEEAILHFENNS
ncbi:MerR family transcriptional regulator [Shouchella sp. JSM 1781072]|uniref:MerR family transcriptional regulator n=1 Tax=Bacillaceae TaxID=186817 RepID=UPI00159BD031|nr:MULTISPECIES: MerR family transcriptional regulator [Bacillaceae]UTR06133.1 MerR family transcriptional regulator [Alkalihalobacillus sp. LMS6]